MTLTAEQSSNKARYEAAPTAEIIDIIRTAMGQGCIRPCHVYDAVDELICRIQDLENGPKRNCDVGTVADQLERFEKWFPTSPYNDGQVHRVLVGYANWAQMPYEGGAK